jgi:hypothetical protein
VSFGRHCIVLATYDQIIDGHQGVGKNRSVCERRADGRMHMENAIASGGAIENAIASVVQSSVSLRQSCSAANIGSVRGGNVTAH